MESLCEDCLNLIVSTLSPEAKKVFKIVVSADDRLSKMEIQERTNLSYTINRNAIAELEHKQLISYVEYGRAKTYALTPSGERLKENIKGVK